MKKTFFFVSLILLSMASQAQTLSDKVQHEIPRLEHLVKVAHKKGISTVKEQTALATAEVFSTYADWDSKHISFNKDNFSLLPPYNKDPMKWATLLPDFERQEILTMLIDAQEELSAVLDGQIRRLPSPDVDWSKLSVEQDHISYENKPVFLADWTWKPKNKLYSKYFGNLDGFLISLADLKYDNGSISVSKSKLEALKDKGEGTLGFIFMNHNNIPSWIKKKYPELLDGPGIKYTMYDISNPQARALQHDLIKHFVPQMAGKRYSKLGYMLCNEPHWNCIDNTWASCPISDYAYDAFREWLKKRHQCIDSLNVLWNSHYTSFAAIDGPKMMSSDQRGTPMYLDFMLFNQDRVTDWFDFLQSEIKKYDPEAKTHIKIMPNLWSDNKRDSGIDLEALTAQSGIIGNDASTCGAHLWGKPMEWEKTYSFDWAEPVMGYDFMKSVSPNKIIFNTEGHFLSTGKSRDLYMTKEYVRCNYWLATIHGLTATQTWYWARTEDGSPRKKLDYKGYVASNNYQPRVVNEVHVTMNDLNAVGDTIIAFQRQRKPIRLFYSKVSAINESDYMTTIFHTYQQTFFNGYPIGFVTSNILKTQDFSSWDVVLVTKTPSVFPQEMDALQNYIDAGGTVIIDQQSLLTDEYHRPLGRKLKSTKGKVIEVKIPSQVASHALDWMKINRKHLPLSVQEENVQAGPFSKTCSWRVIPGKDRTYAVNIINIGKAAKKITITMDDGSAPKMIINMLTGEQFQSNSFDLPVYGMQLLSVK